MRRIVPACAVALCLGAAGLSAQDATIKSKTKIDADDAKPVTVTGCLSSSPSGFTLSNVSSSNGHDVVRHEDSKKAVGTSGVLGSYELSPRDGVELAHNVGNRVEIMGVMVKAAKDGDHDAKIEVKDTTKVDIDHAPDTKSETTTKAKIARGATPKLAVLSVKMIAPSCS